MSALPFVSAVTVEALGWALLHSLWQGAALWLVLEAVLAWPGLRSPRVRGRLAGGALAVFVLLVAGTYGWLAEEAREALPASAPMTAGATGASPILRVGSAVSSESGEMVAVTPMNPVADVAAALPWRKRLRPVLPWLVGLWAAGVAVGLLRHGREWWVWRRLRRAVLIELPPEWRARFAALWERCAPGRRLPRIGETASVRTPLVLGGFASAILLPAGFLAGLSAAQVEAVLAHEIAHLVRRDFWVNVLQCVAEAVFFFHPAVHAFGAHIRRERERACDDRAVEWTGDALGYVKALAALAVAEPERDAGGLALAADGREPGDLLARVGRLLGRPARPARRAPGGWMALGVVALYAALFAASPVIVAQVVSPEKRVELVKAAVAETLPRRALDGGQPRYPEGTINILSELQTEDGSPAPKRVSGISSTRNGDSGSSGSFVWQNGRGKGARKTGVVSLIAVAEDDWAPVAIFDVAPVVGATEVVVPPMILRKGRPLRVRLSEPEGKALVGAKVEVRVWPRGADHLNGFYRKSWVSDAEGLVVLPNADPAFVYELTAALPGRQGTVRVIENFTPEVTVAWVLPVSSPIRGQVVDKVSGEAVAGASVWLAGTSGTETIHGQNFGEAPLATTDAEGRFELPGWDDAGTYGLRFAHATHANAVAGARPGEPLRVELEPGGYRVAGRLRVLTDRARQFMTPTRLSVSGWVFTGRGSSFAPSLAECEMTPEGEDVYRFAFDHVPGGTTYFSFVGATSRVRLFLRGDRLDLELAIDDEWLDFAEGSADALTAKAAKDALKEPEPQGPKRAVEIVVKASDGGQVPYFRMSYLVTPADLPKDFVARYFKYAPVEAGKLTLMDTPVKAKVTLSPLREASHAGYWIPHAGFEVPEGDGPYRHEIPAYPAGAAVIEVLEADGLALVYDRVGLEGRDPFVPEDQAGRFSIEDSNTGGKKNRVTVNCVPLDGRYRVVALDGARVARSEWFTLDASRPRGDATVRFAPGTPIRMRVRTDDGKPVAGMRVSLGYQSDSINYVPTWGDAANTGEDGDALFHAVTVDESVRYRLEVTPQRDWQQQRMIVSATRPEEWLLTLRPGLKLSGRVVDGSGRPVADAQVSGIVDVGDDWRKAVGMSPMAAEEPTDAEGRFRLSNLIPGRLRIRVEQRMPAKGSEFPRLELTGDVKEELRIVVE